MKRPSFQFYPGDWLNDAALRTCSVSARGLWIEMLCLMHQGSDYGVLKVNHRPILPVNLARISGATLSEVEGYLDELAKAGVYSVDDEGCIYSKRMIRDENIREKRASGGVLGGNPALKNIAPKVSEKVNLNANLQPTPSSSSSSSSSIKNTAQDKPAIPPRKKKIDKTGLPENFGISERVRDWAAEKRFDRLDEHLDAFRRKATAKAYSYASWDDAFMEAIQEDWAKLRAVQRGNYSAPDPAATVPSRQGVDPALAKAIKDSISGAKPSQEIREKIAQLTGAKA